MSEIQTQCWICPLCLDDKHHQPGDDYCKQNQDDNSWLLDKASEQENKVAE